jgi:site-specific recombinase XerD
MSRRPDDVGLVATHVAGFRAELARLGYSPSAANRHVALLGHVSRWLAREGLDAAVLATERVESFFQSRRAAGSSYLRTRRSAAPLLGYLRRVGVVGGPQPPVITDPVEMLVQAFGVYLLRERGLVDGTVRGYVRVARAFLSGRQGPGGVDLVGLSAVDVTGFATQACEPLGTSAARGVVSALRSLLRFLHWEGLCRVRLDQAVLSVAGWASPLPKVVPAGQVRRLLDGCDRATVIGRRDYAIVLLLARLGLRAGEVIALELGDIEWRSGQVMIRGKGNRHDWLPLPADVGEAVANYLRHGRPASGSRRVFLRDFAPNNGFQTSSGVIRGVVARACHRAHLPVVSPHHLRHSLASDMLRCGGSLTEIGQVLRHRSMATTAVYAQVDLPRLRRLAQPWPDGGGA